MAKFLVIANYSADGAKGLLKGGGSERVKAVEELASGLGGSVESFYFAFGAEDAYVVVDLPDNTSAAAVGLAVSATGLVGVRTVVLLTPDEIDAAAKKTVKYRAPGQ